MLPGHASLPNGFGLDFVDGDGQAHVPGVAPNALTSTRLARRVCRHALAQARARPYRTGARCGGSEMSRHREAYAVTATQHLLQ